MGISYAAIPGVGALNTWPKLGSIALLNLMKRIAAYRETSIPSVEARLIKKYVKYDAAGSSSGGGATGTKADPWLVDTEASMKILTAAAMVAGLGLAIRRGDKIYANAANADHSIIVNQPNVTIGAWVDPAAPSNEIPAISGYRPAGTPTSVVGTVATFTTGAVRTYWVRGKSTAGTYLMYRDQPYKRKASLAAFNADAEAYSFFDDGVSSCVVNFGAHDPATLQLCVSTSHGIQITNVDGCALEDLDISGFGTNAMGTSNGGQCIRVEVEDTNEFCARRIIATDGGYHTTAHLVSQVGHGGGITSWIDCLWGYFGWDSTGNGDANVCFSYNGGLEVTRRNCECRWGGLPADGVSAVRGQIPYCHTHGVPLYIGLLIDIYSNVVPQVGRLLTCNLGIDVPTPSDNQLTAEYRIFTHGMKTYTTDAAASGAGMCGFHSNLSQKSDWNPTGGAFIYPTGVNASSVFRGVMVNPEIETNCLPGVWTPTQLSYFFANAAHDHDLVHPRFRFKGAAPGRGVHFQYSPYLANCAMWNPVISDETGSAAANDAIDYPETDPAVSAGGMAAPAVFGFASTQYDGCPGYVTLGAAADYDRSNIPAAIINSSRTLPTNLECEYDFFEQRRNTDHTKRTRGPIEARPIGVLPHKVTPAVGVAVSALTTSG